MDVATANVLPSRLQDKPSPITRRSAQITKQVPDITQYGYTMTKCEDDVDLWQKWYIYNSGNYKNNPLNIFGFTPGLHTIAIFEAWNGDDDTHNRLKLRDLMLGFW